MEKFSIQKIDNDHQVDKRKNRFLQKIFFNFLQSFFTTTPGVKFG